MSWLTMKGGIFQYALRRSEPRHGDDMGDLAPSDVRLGVIASEDV
jgi:hypothetical protein